jgi:hypothetical protein
MDKLDNLIAHHTAGAAEATVRKIKQDRANRDARKVRGEYERKAPKRHAA